MRDLCSVVRVACGDMLDRGHHGSVRGTVAAKLVGDQPSRLAPLPLHQLAEEPLGSAGVAPSLDQNVDHVAILIYRTPEVVALPADRHEYFI